MCVCVFVSVFLVCVLRVVVRAYTDISAKMAAKNKKNISFNCNSIPQINILVPDIKSSEVLFVEWDL